MRKLRICAGCARYRILRAEIDRFLARTETHAKRKQKHPKMSKSKAKGQARNKIFSAHSSLNARLLFIPLASFGNWPIGGWLMKTVVPDDESLPSQSFAKVGEDKWNEGTARKE